MATPVKSLFSICALLALAAAGPLSANLSAQTAAPQLPPSHPPIAAAADDEPSYVPQRVYDTQRKRFTDFEMMGADLARADVVLVGEQHDDDNTHRLELAILEGFARRHVPVTLSLEMFERDVQEAVDTYVGGSGAEAEFLKGSRPWPRYQSDYRPLVEFAKAHKWPLVASNLPRRIASDIAKGGRPAVDALSTTDRKLAASDLQCPHDGYFTRFAETMGTHPAAPSGSGGSASSSTDSTERYYLAQCVKDETMAESIANAYGRLEGRPGAVVHVTGAFHSDYGEGTGERVRRRLAGRRVTTVSVIPVESLDDLSPDSDDLKRADYLVFTIK